IPGNSSTEANAGIFSNRTTCRLSEISDGSSNVMMFGETTGGKVQGTNRRQYGHTWIGSGALVTAWDFSTTEVRSFSSEHPNVVQFCFADGSVRKVSTNIDHDNFVYISAKSDARQPSFDAVQ